MRSAYLDNAATTPLRSEVIQQMQNCLSDSYGNPSSTHFFGRNARTQIEKTRKRIAAYFKVKPSEIIFTSGGTEGDNMVLIYAVRDLKINTIITSKIEHHAVLYTALDLQKKYDINIQFVKTNTKGDIDLDHLESLLKSSNPSKTLVSLMHINNEIGNITDLHLVGNLTKSYEAYFHSDTVQSVGHHQLDIPSLNLDFFVGAAHKFHGPKGIGFLYFNTDTGMSPILLGGQQERGLRGGTESLHNIVGLDKAFEIAYEKLEKEKTYISNLKKYFIKKLEQSNLTPHFNGDCLSESSAYNIINVCLQSFSDNKADVLMFYLDIKKIACSKGSACQSGSAKGSHVINAIQEKNLLSKPSIRFSLSVFNTIDEIDYTIEALEEIYLKIK